MTALRERLGAKARERATLAGRPPRSAYQHYFIESDGLHSRVHLQNFWSTFWPQVDEPAVAHVQLFGADGTRLGQLDRPVGRFSSLFLEVRDLLAELGADAAEGTVAIDLEPPAGVRREFGDVPKPESVEVKTPFWMAYYDAGENYMYVHSIEQLHGESYGAPSLLTRSMDRHIPEGETWRSWRLLEVEDLSELQIVAINHAPTPRATTVGVYPANAGEALFETRLEFAPRQLHRVRVPADALAGWRDRVSEVPLARVGLDPLLTGNGKPYVLMRYGDGPLSLHHG
jgi:hypothetical protein